MPCLRAPGFARTYSETTIRYALHSVILAVFFSTMALAAASGMRVNHAPFVALLLLIWLPVMLASHIARKVGYGNIAAAMEVLTCGLLVTLPVCLSTYLAIHVGRPLADGLLDRMDRALGFDWQGLIDFVDRREWLASLLALAYQSFPYQLLALPILAIICGHRCRAYVFVMNYVAICLLSSLVAIWFPALGTYTTYGVPLQALRHINAHFGFAFLAQFEAVRHDPNFVFMPAKMAGILTFPSVHAAVAGLCIWAAWPLRPLRYPFLLLNGLMAVSAISHANHYFVDVLAGLTIALVTTSVADRLLLAERPVDPAVFRHPENALAAAVHPAS